MRKILGFVLCAVAVYAFAWLVYYSMQPNVLWYWWATGANLFFGSSVGGTILLKDD
jgi:hypothetical protein